MAFLISVVNGFSGIQSIGFHRNESKDPSQTIPTAIKWSVVIVLIFAIVTTLTIAMVIPHEKLILIGGIIQTIHYLFELYGLVWLEPIIVCLIVLGVLAEITSWVIGPSKGIAAASQSGYLFKKWGKLNKCGVPINVLIAQGILSTLLASVVIFTPSISFAYWLLSVLTGQFALLMWVMVFSSVLFHLYTESIPAFWLKTASIVGLLVSLSIAIFGYFPPTSMAKTFGDVILYESFLFGGLILFVITPLLVHYFRTRIRRHL